MFRLEIKRTQLYALKKVCQNEVMIKKHNKDFVKRQTGEEGMVHYGENQNACIFSVLKGILTNYSAIICMLWWQTRMDR